VERLKKILFSRAQNFNYPQMFTLVNITNVMAGVSFGFAPAPQNILYKDASLAFTFVLHPEAELKYQTQEPPFVTRISQHVIYWGFQREREYLTIHVQTSDILEAALSIREYEYLYLVLGAITKNLVIFKEFEQHGQMLDRNSIPAFFTSIYNLELASLFYQVPYRNWVYNKKVWEDCPEVLPVSSINPYSALYYSVFLSNKTLTTKLLSNMGAASHLLNELYKYYLASQKMLISNQVGENTIDEEHDFAVSFIYPASVYCIFHMLNVPGYREWKPRARSGNLFEWLNQVTVKVQEDIFINPDVQFLAQIPNLCRDAIVNKLSTFRKAAVILGEQLKQQFFTQK